LGSAIRPLDSDFFNLSKNPLKAVKPYGYDKNYANQQPNPTII
jgi:hypothetical protein